MNTPPAAAQECCEVSAAPNTAAIPQPGEFLGTSVAVDGGTAVAGAPFFDFIIGEIVFPEAGRAIVFNFTGSSWVQVDELHALDHDTDDRFGQSVALDGDFAVIGAPRNDDHGTQSGSAYIFERVGPSWIQVAKLTASDAEANELFGWSVAIQGDLAVVGATFGDSDTEDFVGAVYVFDRNEPNPGEWGEVAKLYASDAFVIDRFGASVSIDGPVIVVGAPQANDQPFGDEGKAYIFRFVDPDWVQEAILTASDAFEDDHFGTSVSVAGDVALIGAPFNTHAQVVDSGAAYVFRFDSVNNIWPEEQILSACNPLAHDQFGTSVSISGGVAVVGAMQPVGFPSGNGRADAFGYFGTGWARLNLLTASDAGSDDRFGASVSISGGRAVVGAFGWDISSIEGAMYGFDGLDSAATCDCPWDLDGDCAVGVKDLLILLGAWGSCDAPCPPSCPADFDGDCDVGVKDLLDLLGNWGLCLCGEGLPPPPGLAQVLEDACVSQKNWDKYVEKMTDPNASQEDKDRYDCWMRHYLFECNCFFCMAHNCPAPDPYTP